MDEMVEYRLFPNRRRAFVREPMIQLPVRAERAERHRELTRRCRDACGRGGIHFGFSAAY